jgi:hypothetical protein
MLTTTRQLVVSARGVPNYPAPAQRAASAAAPRRAQRIPVPAQALPPSLFRVPTSARLALANAARETRNAESRTARLPDLPC